MLCPNCGFYSDREESVCPECGKNLLDASLAATGSIQSLRQGKRAREAAAGRVSAGYIAETGKRGQKVADNRENRSEGVLPKVWDTRKSADEADADEAAEGEAPGIVERRRRNTYDEDADEITALKYLAAHDGKGSSRRMVNWMKISIIGIIAAALLMGGGWLFLNKTNPGQKLIARMGGDATSVAMWQVGDEMLNQGNIDKAIQLFEQAKKKDEAEGVVDVDGLLTLGSAYEAADRPKDAAALYEQIYNNTPSRTEAYVNHIRILENSQDEKDLVKAAELMKKAYEKTGEKTFLTQRNDLLPAPPEVNLTAAYYDTKKTLIFTQYQGYDVYYTFREDAVLPDEGTKATKEGYMMDEGVYNLRAVAVNGELVSDELRGTYKIIMPSPQTPRANLAPNTYKSRQSVKLKPGLDDMNDTSIVIYYTVDGSAPDSDSPVFDGEPIQLPNGWVTLKAVAVNRYHKLSNTLEIKYKIEANPKPKTSFTLEDTVDSLKLMTTTQNEFFKKYGEGTAAGAIEMEGMESECRRYDYSWGYAVMTLNKRTWVLAAISFHDASPLTGPRETRAGDTMQSVVEKFKDMQQVESKSGNRGLYSNGDGTGKIWVQDNGEKIIRYSCHMDTHWIQLEYLVNKSGTVRNIDFRYIP